MTLYHPGERACALALFVLWLIAPLMVWFAGAVFVYWDLAWTDQEAPKGIIMFELFWVRVAVMA